MLAPDPGISEFSPARTQVLHRKNYGPSNSSATARKHHQPTGSTFASTTTSRPALHLLKQWTRDMEAQQKLRSQEAAVPVVRKEEKQPETPTKPTRPLTAGGPRHSIRRAVVADRLENLKISLSVSARVPSVDRRPARTGTPRARHPVLSTPRPSQQAPRPQRSGSRQQGVAEASLQEGEAALQKLLASLPGGDSNKIGPENLPATGSAPGSSRCKSRTSSGGPVPEVFIDHTELDNVSDRDGSVVTDEEHGSSVERDDQENSSSANTVPSPTLPRKASTPHDLLRNLSSASLKIPEREHAEEKKKSGISIVEPEAQQASEDPDPLSYLPRHVRQQVMELERKARNRVVLDVEALLHQQELLDKRKALQQTMSHFDEVADLVSKEQRAASKLSKFPMPTKPPTHRKEVLSSIPRLGMHAVVVRGLRGERDTKSSNYFSGLDKSTKLDSELKNERRRQEITREMINPLCESGQVQRRFCFDSAKLQNTNVRRLVTQLQTTPQDLIYKVERDHQQRTRDLNQLIHGDQEMDESGVPPPRPELSTGTSYSTLANDLAFHSSKIMGVGSPSTVIFRHNNVISATNTQDTDDLPAFMQPEMSLVNTTVTMGDQTVIRLNMES